MLGRWAHAWSSKKMLLFMQHQRREVWPAFERLCLPKWDKYFIPRCLWKKLPVGTRMERIWGKDNRVENHEHVFLRFWASIKETRGMWSPRDRCVTLGGVEGTVEFALSRKLSVGGASIISFVYRTRDHFGIRM